MMRDRLGLAPRLVILKGGAIGDFLAITPALRALRLTWPRAHITLITTPYLEPIARRYASIDRVLVTPPYRGVRNDRPEDPVALARFFAEQQAERYDLALQWHGGGTQSNPYVLQLGARWTAGFKGDEAPPLDVWIPYDIHQPEVLRFLDVLALLGVKPQGYATEFPITAADAADLTAQLPTGAADRLAAGRYLVVHPGAGAPSRRWPAERFAAVIDHLIDEFDLPTVAITGGPGEAALAAAVVRASHRPARLLDLSNRLSLGALAVLIDRCRLYIGNDTGVSHLANALGVPAVIIFGSGPPSIWAPLHRTWQRPVADWSAPCRTMLRDGCADTPAVPCLQNVSIAAVLQHARDLLRLPAPRQLDGTFSSYG